MPSRVGFLVVAILMAFAVASEPSSDQAIPSITPAEVESQREAGAAPLVVDVRTPEEYAAGHIPGAVNVPYDEVATRISELDDPHGVVLYCMVGPRARKGEAALLRAGHEKVFHLEGGLAAWQASGLPVVSEP